MASLEKMSEQDQYLLERCSSLSSSMLSESSEASTSTCSSAPHSSAASSSTSFSSNRLVAQPVKEDTLTGTSTITMDHEEEKTENQRHLQPMNANKERHRPIPRYTRHILQEADTLTPRTALRLVVLPHTLPGDKPRPRVRREPRQRTSRSDKELSGLSNQIETPSHLSLVPVPTPSIIITDHSLLTSALTRYASSPRCLSRINPYHNVTDPRFLTRYPSGPKSRSTTATGGKTISHEINDHERFAEMGGQRSVVVVVVGRRHVGQWREVGVGCPSGSCLCRGRGVAMWGCEDLREEEEDGGDGGDGGNGEIEGEDGAAAAVAVSCSDSVRVSVDRVARLKRMPSRDRIEEARRTRRRIEERYQKKHEVASSKVCSGDDELNAIQVMSEDRSRSEPGRTRTVRRKTSRFTEIGCMLDDDSMETVCSTMDASETDQKGIREVSAIPAVMPVNKISMGRKSAKKKGSWIRKLLRI